MKDSLLAIFVGYSLGIYECENLSRSRSSSPIRFTDINRLHLIVLYQQVPYILRPFVIFFLEREWIAVGMSSGSDI